MAWECMAASGAQPLLFIDDLTADQSIWMNFTV